MKKILIITILVLSLSTFIFGQIPKKFEIVKKPKSPKKALIMSAIVPGAGQFYSKSKIAGIVYGALEITGLTSAILLKQSGEDGKIEYKKYADGHWNVNYFLEGYTGNPKTHDMIIIVDGNRYSVRDDWNSLSNAYNKHENNVTAVKDYHFYENIGKYKQFQDGWIDFGDSTGYETLYRSSPYQSKYSDMRYDTNQLLKSSSYVVSAIMFNHIVSAIDAMVRTRKYNDGNSVSFNMNAVPLVYDDNGAILNFEFRF